MQDTSDLPDISPLTATASVDNTSTSESSGGSTGGPADLDLTESIHHHPSKKIFPKYMLVSLLGILAVVGLVAASVLARTNQDVRQQAAGYATCISPRTGALLTHSQTECQGETTFSMCNNGALIPLVCPTGQTCQKATGQCVGGHKPCSTRFGLLPDGMTTCNDLRSFSTCSDGVLLKSSLCTPGLTCQSGACQPSPSVPPYPICKSETDQFSSPIPNSSPCNSGWLSDYFLGKVSYECNSGFVLESNKCVLHERDNLSLPDCRSSSVTSVFHTPVPNSSPCKFNLASPGKVDIVTMYQCNPTFVVDLTDNTCIPLSSLTSCRFAAVVHPPSLKNTQQCLLNDQPGYYECKLGYSLSKKNGQCVLLVI